MSSIEKLQTIVNYLPKIVEVDIKITNVPLDNDSQLPHNQVVVV